MYQTLCVEYDEIIRTAPIVLNLKRILPLTKNARKSVDSRTKANAIMTLTPTVIS